MHRLIPPAIRHFLSDQQGATAIEYALIASAIAGVLAATIVTLGVSVNTMWTSVANALH
jgi:pilus assembly protein Flp/PilA